MKKVITTLVVVAALFAGSVSFAGIGGPKSGGGRTATADSSLNCTTASVSALECTVTTDSWE